MSRKLSKKQHASRVRMAEAKVAIWELPQFLELTTSEMMCVLSEMLTSQSYQYRKRQLRSVKLEEE